MVGKVFSVIFIFNPKYRKFRKLWVVKKRDHKIAYISKMVEFQPIKMAK